MTKKKESWPITSKSTCKVALPIEDRVVAKGITLSGDVLHGHALPLGFMKVRIEEVLDPQAKVHGTWDQQGADPSGASILDPKRLGGQVT